MPARSASARIFASSALSFIGPKSLNSGLIHIGDTNKIRKRNGAVPNPAYTHQHLGAFLSSKYGIQTIRKPRMQIIISDLRESPSHFPNVWFERLYACWRAYSV